MDNKLAAPKSHLDANAAELADFLTAKERVLERMDGVRLADTELRRQISEGLRDFEYKLERLRKQVEPMVTIPATPLRAPVAPHSTPLG